VNGTTFRLFVWDNAGPGLQPNSHGTHLYSDLNVPLSAANTWGEFDIAASNVVVPDTFWIGLCYNVLSTPADWYISMNTTQTDNHTYINLNGGAGQWVDLGNYGYAHPYGVRVIVDVPGGLAHDVGTISYDSPTVIPLNSTYPPQATVRNYGENAETFDVTCTVNPGGYSSTRTVTGLPPATNQQVTFDPCTFTQGNYTATVFTDLSGDLRPDNDTLQRNVLATDWLHYDDANPSSGWAYWYVNNGWAIGFPTFHDLWVDSVAAHMFNATWPVPGGDVATYELYSGTTDPTNFLWDAFNVTITRGIWNFFSCDTTFTRINGGEYIYFNYIQTADYPNCPALTCDAGLNGPASAYWDYSAGNFTQTAPPGGDWLMAVHVVQRNIGVSEWIPASPHGVTLNIPTVSKGETKIEFSLPQSSKAELLIYDVSGRLHRTLVSGELAAGRHVLNVDLDLPAGIYFYNLKTESGLTATKKCIVVR
jgi:hypothetical protein